MPKASLISIASYIPEKILTNFDFEKMVETSDEWIVKRTGIEQRHIATNETTSDLGTKAGAIGMNLISNKEGNMPAWTQAVPVMNGWTKSKELGSLKFKKFRDLYAEHEKNKKKEKK